MSASVGPLPPEPLRSGGVLGYLRDGGLWGIWLGLSPLILFMQAPPRLPVYLYGTADTRLASESNMLVTGLLILLGIIPAIVSMLSSRMRPAQALPIAALGAMVVLMITISLLGSSGMSHATKPLLAAFVFGLAIVLVSCEVESETFIRNLLIGYAAMHAAGALIALLDANFVWGRLQGRIGPNFWGAVCAYALLAASVTRKTWLFMLLAAISLTVLMLTQNRSSMVALVAGGLLIIFLAYHWAALSGKLWMWLAGLAVGVVLVFAMPALLSDVLMIDDPRRGVESGGTGRALAWSQALAVFEQNPLLGVGYRNHEQYLHASSAHQAYLATAADMGIFGLLLYMVFLAAGIGAGLYKAITHRSKAYAALTAMILAYAVHGFFEQRAFNFANSVSLMIIMAVALVTKVNLEARRVTLPRVPGRA